MSNLWQIIHLELMLYWRGRAIWAVVPFMILLGLWLAAQIRSFPPNAWPEFPLYALFVTLLLTFTTGDQISKDHERRLDGVLLSTPVSTGIYVLGKYLAALLLLLGLAGISLLAAILMDQFYNWQQPSFILPPSNFPPLGFRSYIVGWLYIFLVPVIFGAAFVMASTTLMRGQRILASIGALLFWLPAIIGGPDSKIPALLDILAISFYSHYAPRSDPASQLYNNAVNSLRPPGQRLDPGLFQRVVYLTQQNIPPSWLPASFLWNRLFFLGLAVTLVGATTYIVRQQRRGTF